MNLFEPFPKLARLSRECVVTEKLDGTLTGLKITGSVAAPGFMNPEGIVVYHEHARVAFKKTFDDKHKEAK